MSWHSPLAVAAPSFPRPSTEASDDDLPPVDDDDGDSDEGGAPPSAVTTKIDGDALHAESSTVAPRRERRRAVRLTRGDTRPRRRPSFRQAPAGVVVEIDLPVPLPFEHGQLHPAVSATLPVVRNGPPIDQVLT